MNRTASFIAQLQQRRVFRAVSGYAIGCFVLLQILDAVGDAWGITHQHTRWLVYAMLLALPMVASLSWFFDLRQSGSASAVTSKSGYTALAFTIGAMLFFGITAIYVISNPSNDLEEGLDQTPIVPTIAVLPLSNNSGNPAEGYFSAGVTQEIWNQLARIDGVRLISLDSTKQLSIAGSASNELNVDYLIEGSANRLGAEIRISVAMIRAADGAQIVSKTYDRQVDETASLFQIFDEVAVDITLALAGQIRGPEFRAPPAAPVPTKNMRAYLLVNEAWWLLESAGRGEEALALLDEAVALDETYIDAALQRERLRITAAENGFIPTRANFELASQHIAPILKEHPDHPFALLLNARLQLQLESDFPAALRSLALIPESSRFHFGVLLYRAAIFHNAGNDALALENIQALEFYAPGIAGLLDFSGRIHLQAGLLEEGFKRQSQAVALAPGNPFIVGNAFWVALFLGQEAQARRALKAAESEDLVPAAVEALALVRNGNSQPLRDKLVELEKARQSGQPPTRIFEMAYFLLGDYAEHIRWTEVREDELSTLYFIPSQILVLGGYWAKLEKWASSVANEQERSSRQRLLAEHKSRIARITEKMVVE